MANGVDRVPEYSFFRLEDEVLRWTGEPWEAAPLRCVVAVRVGHRAYPAPVVLGLLSGLMGAVAVLAEEPAMAGGFFLVALALPLGFMATRRTTLAIAPEGGCVFEHRVRAASRAEARAFAEAVPSLAWRESG